MNEFLINLLEHEVYKKILKERDDLKEKGLKYFYLVEGYENPNGFVMFIIKEDKEELAICYEVEELENKEIETIDQLAHYVAKDLVKIFKN